MVYVALPPPCTHCQVANQRLSAWKPIFVCLTSPHRNERNSLGRLAFVQAFIVGTPAAQVATGPLAEITRWLLEPFGQTPEMSPEAAPAGTAAIASATSGAARRESPAQRRARAGA